MTEKSTYEELKQKVKELEQAESERKQVEEALRESEEKYRTLFENTGEAIYVAQDGMIKFPNPKTLGLYGYSEKELSSGPRGPGFGYPRRGFSLPQFEWLKE